MHQKQAVFLAGLNCPTADGGWLQVDACTLENEGWWKI